eukprot:14479084-Alexandrium_andersonii.AAC.1
MDGEELEEHETEDDEGRESATAAPQTPQHGSSEQQAKQATMLRRRSREVLEQDGRLGMAPRRPTEAGNGNMLKLQIFYCSEWPGLKRMGLWKGECFKHYRSPCPLVHPGHPEMLRRVGGGGWVSRPRGRARGGRSAATAAAEGCSHATP